MPTSSTARRCAEPGLAVRAEQREAEHPLLGLPRRDVITSIALVSATVILCVLVAFARAPIQRVDDAFLRRMVTLRSAPLTGIAKVFKPPASVTPEVSMAKSRKFLWLIGKFSIRSAVMVSDC